MRIEKKVISYVVYFSRGKDNQKTTVLDVKDEKTLVSLARKTFKGRFKRPEALTAKDGVRIIIKKLDHVRQQTTTIMSTLIYNKSVRQARIEFEQAIVNY